MNGASNMRRDEELLHKAITGELARPLFRVYAFSQPTITIGYNQRTDGLDRKLCEKEGIPIVRRPTGGRAILHHNELTYSVVVPPGQVLSSLSVSESYRLISTALSEAFSLIGMNVGLMPGERGWHKTASCFASSSKYELSAGGKKLVGSAQRRLGKGLLQQGSILLDRGYERLATFLTDKNGYIDKGITVREIRGEIPSRLEFESALLKGFRRVLGAKFAPCPYNMKHTAVF